MAHMAYIIGTDEAGYGPNLGPLVVSATLWETDGDDCDIDLFSTFSSSISQQANRADGGLIQVADSKLLYKPHGTLRKLERALFSFLGANGQFPTSWHELCHMLCPKAALELSSINWYQNFVQPLPVDVTANELTTLVDRLKSAFDQTRIRCLKIDSEIVFAATFNRQLDHYGNKANLLSATSLQLIDRLLGQLGDEPVLVQCDKHGGRSKYAGMLQSLFPDHLVEIVCEGQRESVYRFGPRERRVEFRFAAKGERFLPAALASIACKYVREIAMKGFNGYWSEKKPGLKPTAGYPVDAKRFFAEIEQERLSAGVDEKSIWRLK